MLCEKRPQQPVRPVAWQPCAATNCRSHSQNSRIDPPQSLRDQTDHGAIGSGNRGPRKPFAEPAMPLSPGQPPGNTTGNNHAQQARSSASHFPRTNRAVTFQSHSEEQCYQIPAAPPKLVPPKNGLAATPHTTTQTSRDPSRKTSAAAIPAVTGRLFPDPLGATLHQGLRPTKSARFDRFL